MKKSRFRDLANGTNQGRGGAVADRPLCLSEVATCGTAPRRGCPYEAVRVCSSFRRKPESMCFAFVFYFLIDSRQ